MFTSKPIEPQRTVFTIRIVYKSGYVHDFDVYNFKYTFAGGNTKYEWEHVSDNNKPIMLGIDDIAAVWQLGVK